MNDIDVKRLRIRPGDVVVVEMPGTPTSTEKEDAGRCLRSALDNAGHPGTPILLLAGGVTLTVAGSADVAADVP